MKKIFKYKNIKQFSLYLPPLINIICLIITKLFHCEAREDKFEMNIN